VNFGASVAGGSVATTAGLQAVRSMVQMSIATNSIPTTFFFIYFLLDLRTRIFETPQKKSKERCWLPFAAFNEMIPSLFTIKQFIFSLGASLMVCLNSL